MAHAKDPHVVFVKTEQDPVIADPQAEGTGHVAVQGRDIAAACPRVMQDTLEDAHGGGAIQMADVGCRPWRPRATRYGRAALFVQREIF
jgi:hypothetical protein